MLEAFGARVIDTDIVAREVVEPGQPALAKIVEQFGSAVLDSSGRLDRRRMRERVFTDPQSRARLEAVLHPAIRARTLDLMRAGAESPAGGGGGYLVVVVPLLVETGFARFVDRVLVVECPRERQLERLVDRDGMTRELAESMLSAQADPQTRASAADDIIDNSGSIACTRAQTWRLHLRYLRGSPIAGSP